MLTAAAEKTPPSADSLIGAAVKTAQAKDKVVLVHFGASWCVWCRHLDEMLQGKELGKLIAEHFVVVHLTVQERDEKKSLENPGAEDLMNAQGAGKSGVPVFMFFNKDGKKIADSLAFPKSQYRISRKSGRNSGLCRHFGSDNATHDERPARIHHRLPEEARACSGTRCRCPLNFASWRAWGL